MLITEHKSVMLITEHKFNPELSYTPDLIFVDASFSILYPSKLQLANSHARKFFTLATIVPGAAKAANRRRKLVEQKE